MRYILDDLGYIEEVSFGGYIECNNKTCTEYTGAIPEGYDSLFAWVENSNIRAYKIENSNLIYDEDKDAELQTLYVEELKREVKITSTNNPPDSTGNWELIDKDFTPASGNATFTRSNASSGTLAYSRHGHSIYCRLTFVNSITLNDTAVTIGTVGLASLGVADLTYGKYAVGQSDGGGALLMISIGSTGSVVVNDVIDKGGSNIVSSGATCYVEWTNVINMGNMLDSACNKFYWRRTK